MTNIPWHRGEATRNSTAENEYDVVPGSDAYHELRNSFALNGSDFASAIGVGYISRKRLWEIKTGRYKEKPDEELQRMLDWGTLHEPDALDCLQTLLDAPMRRCGIFEYPTDKRFAATPDAINLEDGCPCEVKCPFTKEASSPALKYWVQMQTQAACVGSKGVHFLSWRPDGEPCHYRWVKFEPEAWQQIYKLACDFVAYVEKDIEPPRLSRRPRFVQYESALIK